MLFMNTWEIDEAVSRHYRHPILGPAARLLRDLRDLVDSCSDGWAYWKAPVRAAKKLMELLQDRGSITEAEARTRLKRALTPIKAFVTKNKPKYFPDQTLNFPEA